MPKRAVLVIAEVKDPITSSEIDLALVYAYDEYTVELKVDVLRPLFNTIQARRESGMRLELLVDMIVRNNILESADLRRAYKAAIMKIYNHRNLMKIAADEAKKELGMETRPAVEQTVHPIDFSDIEQRQRVLLE